MRKGFLFIAVLIVLLAGCIRDPNYDGVVQIQTNEIAFLVDMTGDGAVSGSNAEIQRKDIPIPGYFVRTGRFQHQGYWRPTLKVIAVSQAPVRRIWDKSDNTQTVRMVSKESAGFIVPMLINAYISNRESAVKYLSAFRPVSDDTVDWSRLKQKEWSSYVKENAQPLEKALDTVVYTKIMEQLNGLFVRVPILYAEVTSKVFITAIYSGMTANDLTVAVNAATPNDAERIVFDKPVSSIKDWAFETYGITISAMAPGDGVIFDSNEVQSAIDNLAVLSMQERTARQDRVTKLEEQRVREVEARTRQIENDIQRNTMDVQMRRQEIENTKIIAEAQAQAIKAGHYPPVPSTLITDTRLSAFGFPGMGNLTGK